MYAKSYKSIINKLPDITYVNEKISNFMSSYYIDCSIFNIKQSEMFNISRKKEYSKLTSDEKDNESIIENKYDNNCYKELLLIFNKTYKEKINYDFIFGYYLSKIIFTSNKKLIVFHIGFSNSQIQFGIKEGIGNKELYEWIGCDINILTKYSKHYINGISNNGDITDLNTLRSICNQIDTIIKNKINLLICDLKPNSNNLYYIMLFLLNLSCDKAFIRIDLSLDNIIDILKLSLFYKNISIFKSPFEINEKYYLVLDTNLKLYSDKHNTKILKFLSEYKKNNQITLYSNNESDIEILNKIKFNLLLMNNSYDENTINEIFL